MKFDEMVAQIPELSLSECKELINMIVDSLTARHPNLRKSVSLIYTLEWYSHSLVSIYQTSNSPTSTP